MTRHAAIALWDYEALALDAEDARLVEHHLDDCPECRDELEAVRLARRTLTLARKAEPLVDLPLVDDAINQVVERRLAARSRRGWLRPTVALAALLVAGLVGFAAVRVQPAAVPLAPELRIATATLEAVEGVVLDDADALLAPDTTLGEGHAVTTAQGVAQLRLLDSSVVRLAEDSRLIAGALEAEVVRLTLERGRVSVHAAPVPRQRFEVVTPHAVVSVVGTVFSVESDARGTTVSVLEGAVRATVPGGVEVDVSAGQRRRIEGGHAVGRTQRLPKALSAELQALAVDPRVATSAVVPAAGGSSGHLQAETPRPMVVPLVEAPPSALERQRLAPEVDRGAAEAQRGATDARRPGGAAEAEGAALKAPVGGSERERLAAERRTAGSAGERSDVTAAPAWAPRQLTPSRMPAGHTVPLVEAPPSETERRNAAEAAAATANGARPVATAGEASPASSSDGWSVPAFAGGTPVASRSEPAPGPPVAGEPREALGSLDPDAEWSALPGRPGAAPLPREEVAPQKRPDAPPAAGAARSPDVSPEVRPSGLDADSSDGARTAFSPERSPARSGAAPLEAASASDGKSLEVLFLERAARATSPDACGRFLPGLEEIATGGERSANSEVAHVLAARCLDGQLRPRAAMSAYRRYLTAFPQGRYVDEAHRALGEGPAATPP